MKEYNNEIESTIQPILYSSRSIRLQIFCRLTVNFLMGYEVPKAKKREPRREDFISNLNLLLVPLNNILSNPSQKLRVMELLNV